MSSTVWNFQPQKRGTHGIHENKQNVPLDTPDIPVLDPNLT